MKSTSVLAHRWRQSGVQPGDMLLLHSNVSRTLKELRRAGYPDADANDVLMSLLDVVGKSGTLLLPLFNFDFCRGRSFDIRTTPSQMGALTEVARLRDDAVRTGHPVYSFAVIGHHAKAFADVNNCSAYAEDSPFGLLRRYDGKIAVLDLEDQHSMTFYHHVEETKQVDYRYYKEFRGAYTDRKGSTTDREYRIYVRDLEKKVLTHVNPAGELLWQKGLYVGDRPRVDAGMRTIKARDMYDFVAAIIESGSARGLLYEIGV